MSEQDIALLLAGWGLLWAVRQLLRCMTGECDCVARCDCCRKPVAKTYEVAGMELCAECIKEQAS